jgi:hypothetical protein
MGSGQTKLLVEQAKGRKTKLHKDSQTMDVGG